VIAWVARARLPGYDREMVAAVHGRLRVSVQDRVQALLGWTTPRVELTAYGLDEALRGRMRRQYGLRIGIAAARSPAKIVEAVTPVVGPEWGGVLELALERRRPSEAEWAALERAHPPVELLVWAVNRACSGGDPTRARATDLLRRRADPWCLASIELEEYILEGDLLHAAAAARRMAERPEAAEMRAVLLVYAGRVELERGDPEAAIDILREADHVHGGALDGMTAYALALELGRRNRASEAAEVFATVSRRFGTTVGGDEAEAWFATIADVLSIALRDPAELRSLDLRAELESVRDPIPWPTLAFLWASVHAIDVGRARALAALDLEAERIWNEFPRDERHQLAMEVGEFFLEERDPARGRAWCRRGASECAAVDLHWYTAYQALERTEGRDAAEAFSEELRGLARR
jgi:hypothetical protein